jgi:hypothetical protein
MTTDADGYVQQDGELYDFSNVTVLPPATVTGPTGPAGVRGNTGPAGPAGP